MRALNPVEKHSKRIDKKLRATSKVLNWTGLKFPVNLNDINKFENHNSSISVNVFGYENLVYPPRISKHNYKCESTVNPSLISDDKKQHYYWIKDISKLIFTNIIYGHVRHAYFRYLDTFNSKESLASHHEYCKSYEAIKLNFSKRDQKYLLQITIGQCESHLLYMLILNPSHHSCQQANQTLTKATPSSIRNTSPADFVTT